MAFNVDNVIEWCKSNWVLLALVGLVIFIFIMYMKKKPVFKPISRAEQLRKKFIADNKLNYSPLKWCWRGRKLYGKIRTLKAVTLEPKDNKDIDVIELVVEPQLFGIKGLPDIFSKSFCLVVSKSNSDYDYAKDIFDIHESTTFDTRSGVYYDLENKDILIKYIKDRLLISDDWENLSSVYYTKAMEQSTIIPQYAVAIEGKQLDLEAEKEKRKHLVS
jgi:hypothetical protein